MFNLDIISDSNPQNIITIGIKENIEPYLLHIIFHHPHLIDFVDYLQITPTFLAELILIKKEEKNSEILDKPIYI